MQANVLLANLPLSIVTGSSWAGAPIPGGPAISPDGRRIYCCNSLQIIDTQDNTVVAPPISAYYLSDIALTPDESRILITAYSYGNGVLSAYQRNNLSSRSVRIGGLGDFVGEIVLSRDGQKRSSAAQATRPGRRRPGISCRPQHARICFSSSNAAGRQPDHFGQQRDLRLHWRERCVQETGYRCVRAGCRGTWSERRASSWASTGSRLNRHAPERPDSEDRLQTMSLANATSALWERLRQD